MVLLLAAEVAVAEAALSAALAVMSAEAALERQVSMPCLRFARRSFAAAVAAKLTPMNGTAHHPMAAILAWEANLSAVLHLVSHNAGTPAVHCSVLPGVWQHVPDEKYVRPATVWPVTAHAVPTVTAAVAVVVVAAEAEEAVDFKQ